MAQDSDHRKIERPAPAGRSPRQVAAAILEGFNRHYSLFRYSAQRAKTLFESGNWRHMQQLSTERIEYYDTRVRECVARVGADLRGQAPAESGDFSPLPPEIEAFWQAVKTEYVSLLADHRQPECAETFFNSVSCRLLHRDYYHNNCLFVRPAVATDYLGSHVPAFRVYYPLAQGLEASITDMLAGFGLAAPMEDLPRDARLVARKAVHALRALLPNDTPCRLAPDCQVQVLNTLFFRNKGAYAVGRFINHGTTHPFALALLRRPSGHIYVDALLMGENDLSTLFSFTRAYFLVDMETPAAYVNFLSSLMPRKPKAELYTTIGLQKQGKTLFYRDFLHHLAHSHDKFDVAPGIHGLVMLVFTLPSYPYVFKLIRDRINKPGMTHDTVRRKYLLVKKHDRVGRMADTWEYSQVALPRARFSDTLLAELRKEVPSLLEEDGDRIVLRHVYIERRMTPLNLYVQRANDAALDAAIKGYGDAIKELAAANIFPGDMLYKNFGVTRLGRVVFYDYDEIQNMTEMNFRVIPPAPNEEAELASEPWYPVNPNDVFPEEFRHFLLGDPRVRAAFLKHHADLLSAQWWQACRGQVAQGRMVDIFPYATTRRLLPNSAMLEAASATSTTQSGALHV